MYLHTFLNNLWLKNVWRCMIKSKEIVVIAWEYFDFSCHLYFIYISKFIGVIWFVESTTIGVHTKTPIVKEKWYLYIHLWQFFDNFLSHTYIILLFSLFLFLSPLFLTNEKREKRSCHKSCIKWLFKYHYSLSNS